MRTATIAVGFLVLTASALLPTTVWLLWMTRPAPAATTIIYLPSTMPQVCSGKAWGI